MMSRIFVIMFRIMLVSVVAIMSLLQLNRNARALSAKPDLNIQSGTLKIDWLIPTMTRCYKQKAL